MAARNDITTNTARERTGQRRFITGIEYEKTLHTLSRSIQDKLLANLASNYTKDHNTNLAEILRAVAREFARLQISMADINEDRYHDNTRAEYLFQVLGDSLFLGERAVNELISDVDYREYLIRVRDAYIGGSRPDNIEESISDILGLPVLLKEVYLRLREPDSGYNIKDTHKMFFDVLMDEVTPSSSLGVLLQDLKFFVNMIKPAHVLYDTRLVWTDAREDTNACMPAYTMQDMEYTVNSTSRMYMVTYLAESVYKYGGAAAGETWETGVIQLIYKPSGWIITTDNRIIVYTSDTVFYERTGSTDTVITVDDLSPGDDIRYYATKDSADESDVIEDDWTYTDVIDEIHQSEEIILLQSGQVIVYNDDTLMYTRDAGGEYRIGIDDLRPNFEIIFKADQYTEQFDFYREPEEVQNNFFKQFDSQVIEKPTFQEYVKKDKDIPDGFTEGPVVVVEDGVATVKVIESQFYAREGKTAYRDQVIYRYSLYIDDVYKQQFSVTDPERELTQSEVKNIFITVYGYTQIADPNTNYYITTAKTGELIEDGTESILEMIDSTAEMCDRKASCQLMPFYEDMRKHWTWLDVQLCSGFFITQRDFEETNPGDDAQDIPAWYHLSADPNEYQMPSLPMLGPDGTPAVAGDLVVYVNGLLVEDAVTSVDPWTGIVTLNFLPPYDTTLRVDYYCAAARYPTPQFHLVEYRTGDVVPPLPGDLPAAFNVVTGSGIVKRLWWPFEVSDPAFYGDDLDHQVNKFPILNQRGELATKDEIDVYLGTIISDGTFEIIETVESGVDKGTTFSVITGDITNVESGDTLIIEYDNYLDNTLIYTVSEVDAGAGTIKVPNVVPAFTSVFNFRVVEFNEMPDAVEAVRPILGHIRINFIPPVGTMLRFDYYYTFYERNYLLIPDAPETVGFWDYGGSQYTSDTAYGPRNGYTLLVDQNPAYVDQSYRTYEELLKIGYRYRMLNLSNSSVLNSEATLKLNGYQLYTEQASFKNNGHVLNEYNFMFSPEHLTDTNKHVILNDQYLHNGLPAQTQLNPGVPLFVETFSDDAHHKNFEVAVEVDTYDPDLEGGHDLVGSFTIIDPDKSGLIDYNGVCQYETNEKITLHTDLKTVESTNNGYDAPLSTITEGGKVLPFELSYADQYYPNRELRVNDYLDYINQVPTEYKTGELQVLNTGVIVKSVEANFKALRVGDEFLIKSVPFVEWDEGSSQYITVYRDLPYTLVEIIDFETGRIGRPFKGPSGRYSYDLTRNKAYAVDVYLVEVTRTLILNGLIGHSYSIPDSILMHLTGYGDTGAHYALNFPDPDPDPYPRNPGVTGISYPDVAYYPITGMEIDGKTYRTNRILGVTGIVNTSNIVESSISTDPSGALNLGITGPVEYANPRTYEDYDVYQIPSSYTGMFMSYSEAEYRVQWRNWDQDMMLVMPGGDDGVLHEEPIQMMDDIADGIVQYFWDVANSTVKTMTFSGSVIESSQRVSDNVLATDHLLGLIPLSYTDYDRVISSADPVADLPDLSLGDSTYHLNQRIVREVLHDDSVRITEIVEFVPIS